MEKSERNVECKNGLVRKDYNTNIVKTFQKISKNIKKILLTYGISNFKRLHYDFFILIVDSRITIEGGSILV